MGYRLNILNRDGTGEEYLLKKPVTYIGREGQNDVVLKDDNISKRHAKLVLSSGLPMILDLGSTNGVFVNDRKIEGKAFLKPSDMIQLGRIKFRVSPAEEKIPEQTLILQSLNAEKEWNLDSQRLKLIYDIATELTENQDVKSLGEKIFSKFKETFRQDRAYLALFEKDGDLRPICTDPTGKSIPLSRSIIKRLFQNGESFLLEDALDDTSFKEQESVLALKIRSALCVPLIYHSRIYGLIYLDRNTPGAYKEKDLEFLRSIGSILAPLIENARLWSELKSRYADTVKTLRETQADLIETERTAAYVRLAHAMAHEIRNPLMVMGVLVRKLLGSESAGVKSDSIKTIIDSVERVESVLKEVDSFVKIPPPDKKLHRIDQLIQEEIECHNKEWQEKALHPLLSVNTPHVMIPLDAKLFKKALSMIFQEIIFGIPQGADFNILIRDYGSEVEIVFGEVDEDRHLCEPFDPEIRDKPWSLNLFLNIAHKILSDHGGRLLLDPTANSAFPVIMKIPKSIKI